MQRSFTNDRSHHAASHGNLRIDERRRRDRPGLHSARPAPGSAGVEDHRQAGRTAPQRRVGAGATRGRRPHGSGAGLVRLFVRAQGGRGQLADRRHPGLADRPAAGRSRGPVRRAAGRRRGDFQLPGSLDLCAPRAGPPEGTAAFDPVAQRDPPTAPGGRTRTAQEPWHDPQVPELDRRHATGQRQIRPASPTPGGGPAGRPGNLPA